VHALLILTDALLLNTSRADVLAALALQSRIPAMYGWRRFAEAGGLMSYSAPLTEQFRRAAVLLNQGRLSEAEDQLAGALRADPSHAAARQTYAAMLLEQHRVEAARRLLQETLAVNAAQPAFAVALARIYIEQRDYRNALEVLDKAGPAARNAEFQAMRGKDLPDPLQWADQPASLARLETSIA